MEEKMAYKQKYNTGKQAFRRYKKWVRRKRKEFIKSVKKWNGWDYIYLTSALNDLLRGMAEFYFYGDMVVGSPARHPENDRRYITILTAIDKLESAMAGDNYEEAFTYIGQHIMEWWD